MVTSWKVLWYSKPCLLEGDRFVTKWNLISFLSNHLLRDVVVGYRLVWLLALSSYATRLDVKLFKLDGR